MNYTNVLSKAWRLVWNLRGLWFFGFVLALTTSSGSFWLWNNDGWWNAEERRLPNGISIKLDEDHTVKFLGEGMVIDLTAPDGARVLIQDRNTWYEFRELQALIEDVVPGEFWTILNFAAIELGILLLLGLVGRYVSEAAVMRGVQSHEQSGQAPGFGKGWRLGWSGTAGRLFLIDLVISLTAGLALTVLFAIVLLPQLLWLTDSADAGVLGIALTTMLLFPWIGLVLLTMVGCSLLKQLSWRASSLEGLGVMAAIQRGFQIARRQFKDTFLTWLIWMSTKLAWIPVTLVVVVLLAPLMVATVVLGTIVGAVPALITLGITSYSMPGVTLWQEVTPWILAGLAGLPVFILVTFSPVNFVGGLVRLFQSNIWTLAYPELRSARQAKQPAEQESKAQGMEATPA
ncbi:MAG: hypothetical protein JSV61_08115 [Anaerolineales bacterium]|nr:MAG: hypothetical protein JSV61_08115 [Anaerolineales bacterium]